MQIDLITLDDLEKDNKTYIKGISLVGSVKIDYATGKHMSFIVHGEESNHNVMYFVEKTGDKRWQCDCKWYTLQSKTCSHIIAVNLAIKNSVLKV